MPDPHPKAATIVEPYRYIRNGDKRGTEATLT